MLELANIFKLYGAEYRKKYKDQILPSHMKAIKAIQKCRTPELGGQVYACENGDFFNYSYHSCNSRNCPKCGGDKIQTWVKKQFDLLLPVPYFFATFTLPHELNNIIEYNQRFFYNLFFKASSQALKDLACDRRFIGGEIGFFGIIQTWARNLIYHCHIHYIVPGVALSFDHKKWIKIKDKKFPRVPTQLQRIKQRIIDRSNITDSVMSCNDKDLANKCTFQNYNYDSNNV